MDFCLLDFLTGSELEMYKRFIIILTETCKRMDVHVDILIRSKAGKLYFHNKHLEVVGLRALVSGSELFRSTSFAVK